MGKVKDRNGMDLTEAEDIKRGGKNTQKNDPKKILMSHSQVRNVKHAIEFQKESMRMTCSVRAIGLPCAITIEHSQGLFPMCSISLAPLSLSRKK